MSLERRLHKSVLHAHQTREENPHEPAKPGDLDTTERDPMDSKPQEGACRPPNDGGPAFAHDVEQLARGCAGMTLRDYFAGQALQGELAYYNPNEGDAHTNANPRSVADACYAYADAMLVAREKPCDRS